MSKKFKGKINFLFIALAWLVALFGLIFMTFNQNVEWYIVALIAIISIVLVLIATRAGV